VGGDPRGRDGESTPPDDGARIRDERVAAQERARREFQAARYRQSSGAYPSSGPYGSSDRDPYAAGSYRGSNRSPRPDPRHPDPHHPDPRHPDPHQSDPNQPDPRHPTGGPDPRPSDPRPVDAGPDPRRTGRRPEPTGHGAAQARDGYGAPPRPTRPVGDGRDRLARPIGQAPRSRADPPAHLAAPGERRRWAVPVIAVLVVVGAALAVLQVVVRLDDEPPVGEVTDQAELPNALNPTPTTFQPPAAAEDEPPATGSGFATPGLLTFRGSASRSYYGEGPVPAAPEVLWSYPGDGEGMCAESVVGDETKEWCGSGWTGQPAVFERGGRTWVVFGAYDRKIHFVDYATGEDIIPPFETGDIVKGSVTVDPDGLPLVYSGSRDDEMHVIAFDRPAPVELWALDADDVSPTMWNDDWDGAPLVMDDLLFAGGENSQFHVVKLNRGTGADGLVQVAPELIFNTPGWDDELLASLNTRPNDVSIENSVAYRDGIVYFSNSGGLVQGWDISGVDGGTTPKRVFRYWVGDDTDASVVIDDEGFLYVAAENERGSPRAAEVGQLVKLDPGRPDDPLVWSVDDSAGFWATPALHRDIVIAASDVGTVSGVDRETGDVRWTFDLAPPTWQSPVVVDDTLVQGDCLGGLHAYDVSDTTVAPPERWTVELDGCIESTPAVWHGRLFVGTRGGLFHAVGDA
jgi:outer membrane protein assembly factor BamB